MKHAEAENKCILGRFLAVLASCGILACLVVFAFAVPAVRVKADDETIPETVVDAAAWYTYVGITHYSIAYAVSQNATPNGIALLAAQQALCYAYAYGLTPAPGGVTGQATYCGGLILRGDEIWSGGGYTNESATVSRCDISSTSGGASSFLKKLDPNKSNKADLCKVANANWNNANYLNSYYIYYDGRISYSTQENFLFYVNNDPVGVAGENSKLYIGTCASLGSSEWGRFYEGARVFYYSGGVNVNTIIQDNTDDVDFTTDLEDVHEYFETFDPTLPPELYFFPESEDPTEDPTGGGCNCTHNITVNVDVHVDSTYPSGWLDEVEPPSETVETLPILEEYTLPTFEIDNTTIDGMHFWRDLLDAVVTRSGLVGTVTVILILSIVEWLLWNVGR